MQVIIMRGIPGSGKSTYIKDQAVNRPENTRWCVISADSFFIEIFSGVYRFDPKKIGEAHAFCLRSFLSVLKGETRYDHGCFVDNTNTTAVEIAPYYALALAYGADVKIVRMATPFEVAVTRNTHNVPVSTIWKMQQNLLTERLPLHWNEEFIFPEQK